MLNLKTKHLFAILSLNILMIVLISFGVNYAYSKIYWSNRVSVHSGINSTEYAGDQNSDTITSAYIGQAYKVGTAFEVYKPKDPLLKVVSKNHGAIEFAVASGKHHFSDLAEPRDAIIRKVGEGNLIFSIPSYTNENVRSIIFSNESKVFMELNNFDEILFNCKNLSLDKKGVLEVSDIKLQSIAENLLLTEYLLNINQNLEESQRKIDSLETIISQRITIQ